MPKKQTRRSITVSAHFYAYARGHGKTQGRAMSAVVEEALRNLPPVPPKPPGT